MTKSDPDRNYGSESGTWDPAWKHIVNSCISQRFIRVFICAGITAVVGLEFSLTTEGADVLSNINEPYQIGYSFSSVPPMRAGLGFRSGPNSGIMDGLSISLLSGFSNGSQTISFDVLLYHAASDGLPIGTPVAMDTGVTATWTNSVGGDFHQEIFDYGVAELPNLFSVTLSANRKYVLVLANNSGLPVGEQYWAITNTLYATSDGYDFTTTSLSFDGGGTWSIIADWKPIARISVITVPEPSTISLAILSGITLEYVRSRRKRIGQHTGCWYPLALPSSLELLSRHPGNEVDEHDESKILITDVDSHGAHFDRFRNRPFR